MSAIPISRLLLLGAGGLVVLVIIAIIAISIFSNRSDRQN